MDTPSNDNAQQSCSMCNVPMVNGACPKCGMKAEGSAPSAEGSTPATPTTPQA